jgi:dUTP pyrophosphatase
MRVEARLPTKAHETDACFDLFGIERRVIAPNCTVLISTGICLEIPLGWEGQVRSRSSSFLKELAVHFGTIDHEFREELKVLVRNLSKQPVHILVGQRLAQIKISKVWDIEFIEAEVAAASRGGFGSSGE